MQNELEFTDGDEPDCTSVTPVNWLLRSYDSAVAWKSRARTEYISLNGDSDAARNRVAAIVRTYFTETQLTPEVVGRWIGNEVVKIRLLPPMVTDSNAAYVDWIFIADVLLLHCVADQDEIDKENQRRETEYLRAYNSYKLRIAIEEIQERIRSGQHSSDDALLKSIIAKHPDASIATIKEARRREKTKAMLPKAKEPLRSMHIPPFKPLYY